MTLWRVGPWFPVVIYRKFSDPFLDTENHFIYFVHLKVDFCHVASYLSCDLIRLVTGTENPCLSTFIFYCKLPFVLLFVHFLAYIYFCWRFICKCMDQLVKRHIRFHLESHQRGNNLRKLPFLTFINNQ